MDPEALGQLSGCIYEALICFLRDYSSYLMQYAFIQKHGFKNKIKLAVVIDDVYHCIELYQMIYAFFRNSIVHITPLFLIIHKLSHLSYSLIVELTEK